MTDIRNTLKEREATHGHYHHTAAGVQGMKEAMRLGQSWNRLSWQQKEGLEMIVHKISRMVNGDPYHPDHIKDIIGYATLVEDSMEAVEVCDGH
jgi:uncharacterized protein with von Willebrand factor type A (vWA) domain